MKSMIYSSITDCFSKGVGSKPKCEYKLDFDLLEIIQKLKRKYPKEWSKFSLEVFDKTLVNMFVF